MSTGAVARACGVTRDGVLHWIHAGRLPAFRTPGGHFRVRRDALAAFLRDSGCFYAPPEPAVSARILVVDDEAAIRSLLAELLREAGYQVCLAAGVREGLEAIADRLPDLLITDVALPGEGGAALTRAVRQNGALAAVPVIAVTGAFDSRCLEEIYAAGADLLISKPFQPAHLLGEVRRLLSARYGGGRQASGGTE
ncbi:MAG: response regulator [Acidobacteriota bacterium]